MKAQSVFYMVEMTLIFTRGFLFNMDMMSAIISRNMIHLIFRRCQYL